MRHLLRPVATLAAGVLVATALAGPAHAAPGDLSGTWLERQLNKQHLVYNRQFEFTDYGLSADVAFALDALGGHRRTVRQIGAAVARNVDAYTAPSAGEVYAGAVAKAAVLALTSGRDPRDFGGIDLVSRLEGQVTQAPPNTGRIHDTSSWGDNANTIAQGYAALALAEAGSAQAAPVRAFLLAQQCTEGFFRISFSDTTAEDQSCDGAPGAAPNADVTALTVLALDALPTKGRRVRAAMASAVAWLKSAQRENGSFRPGDSEVEGPNSNSTGLAAWALGTTGSCAPARDAARWIRKLQVRGDVAGTPLAGEKGGIAYDRTAWRAARENGIGKTQRDQWRRATSQAAPGLQFLRVRACRR